MMLGKRRGAACRPLPAVLVGGVLVTVSALLTGARSGTLYGDAG